MFDSKTRMVFFIGQKVRHEDFNEVDYIKITKLADEGFYGIIHFKNGEEMKTLHPEYYDKGWVQVPNKNK